MPNKFETARDWLASKMKATAGRPGHYQRGDSSVEVTLRFARIDTTIDQSSGVDVRSADQDWLIDAIELLIDGTETKPAPGDRIIDGDLSDGQVYEVAQIPGMDIWRWSDPYQKTFHIHTKLIGTAPVIDS